jgi:hypothetical protein
MTTMLRRQRLEMILRLRKQNAPLWVIKSSQVNLVLMRKGLRPVALGKPLCAYSAKLYHKHVNPLMG